MFTLFQEKVETLKIFRWIPKEIVDEIIKWSKRKKFTKWEIIIKEWVLPNGTSFIIESWSVQVIVWNKNTVELSVWDIFGEIALLNDEPRTATVITLEDTQCLLITREDLFYMINNDDNSINKEIIRRMEENLDFEEEEN